MIRLEPITPENHETARGLAVRPDQARFVATVERSLADAYVWSESVFRVACVDGTPVGYLLLFPFSDGGGRRIVNVVRLMVALKLYRSVGFEERGIENGEVALYLEVEGTQVDDRS